MSQDQEKGKLLGNKRQEPDKNEEKDKNEEQPKENIFLMPEPPKVKNKIFHITTKKMQKKIENWDGKDIATLQFVSQEGSVGHKIEIEVRPLLQEWISAKRKQQDLEKELDLETEKRQDWSQLNENGKNITIIKQRVNDKKWCDLNKELCDIQKQITKNTVEISHNSGPTKKPINNNLIAPIYNKYGGKALDIKKNAKYLITIDGKHKNYKYQKKNKPTKNIFTVPNVVKNIKKEHNIKNLEGLIDYFDKQPKDTNTYNDEEIKEIIMYAKWLIVISISMQKTNYKNITSDQAEQLSKYIREKLDPTKQQYTFAQMVDTIKDAHTTYNNTMNNILASKLNNNNNQIQPANNNNNQIQQANNIINNQAEQMDLVDDIPLDDVPAEEIENENGFNNPFNLNFEVDHNQEHNINNNNENVFPTNTINNDISTINNIEKLNIHFITKGK